MNEILASLQQSAYGVLVGKSVWGYAVFECVHLFGIVSLVGAITLTDLRLLGVSRALPVALTSKYLLRWVWFGFALCVIGGGSLFVSDGKIFVANPFFLSKMVLIVLAGLNAAFFEFRVFKGVADWDRGVSTPIAAKICALLSLSFWFAAVAAGRLIAYSTLWP